MSNSLPMTWARRLTLIIGLPVAISLIGWTGFNVVALAGQGSYQVSYRVPVIGGKVTANLGGADMRLRPGQGGTGRLDGTVHYSLIRPSLTEYASDRGAGLRFQCELPAGVCDLNATLSVPAGTEVDVSSGGGDLSVTGFASPVTLRTAGGDVAAAGLAGRLMINSGGGDVGASALSSARVTIESGGGDVSLVFGQPPGNVTVVSGGGDVQVVLPQGPASYDVATSTGGGDLSNDVPVSSSSAHKITVDSGGGDVDITQAR